MTPDHAIEKLLGRAQPTPIIIFALVVLAVLYVGTLQFAKLTSSERAFQARLTQTLELTTLAKENVVSHEILKALDLEQFKTGLSGSALSQKSLYESGLSLQEERRLLEKQLEIMTTSLFVNPALQRIFLMRAEQPLQSYFISYIPLKSYGGTTTALPASVRIVSKERFAHPERGKSEDVNGTLQWTPPQVGTSIRSKALGEFVMFTNSALILHGTPVSPDDHEKFPHICLGLDTDSARKLYRASFIGTRAVLNNVTIDLVPLAMPLPSGTTQ